MKGNRKILPIVSRETSVMSGESESEKSKSTAPVFKLRSISAGSVQPYQQPKQTYQYKRMSSLFTIPDSFYEGLGGYGSEEIDVDPYYKSNIIVLRAFISFFANFIMANIAPVFKTGIMTFINYFVLFQRFDLIGIRKLSRFETIVFISTHWSWNLLMAFLRYHKKFRWMRIMSRTMTVLMISYLNFVNVRWFMTPGTTFVSIDYITLALMSWNYFGFSVAALFMDLPQFVFNTFIILLSSNILHFIWIMFTLDDILMYLYEIVIWDILVLFIEPLQPHRNEHKRCLYFSSSIKKNEILDLTEEEIKKSPPSIIEEDIEEIKAKKKSELKVKKQIRSERRGGKKKGFNPSKSQSKASQEPGKDNYYMKDITSKYYTDKASQDPSKDAHAKFLSELSSPDMMESPNFLSQESSPDFDIKDLKPLNRELSTESSSRKDKDKHKHKDKDKHKDNDNDKHKDKHKDNDNDKHKNKHKDNDNDKHNDKHKNKHKDKHKDKHKHNDNDKHKNKYEDKNNDSDNYKNKHKDNDYDNGYDKDKIKNNDSDKDSYNDKVEDKNNINMSSFIKKRKSRLSEKQIDYIRRPTMYKGVNEKVLNVEQKSSILSDNVYNMRLRTPSSMIECRIEDKFKINKGTYANDALIKIKHAYRRGIIYGNHQEISTIFFYNILFIIYFEKGSYTGLFLIIQIMVIIFILKEIFALFFKKRIPSKLMVLLISFVLVSLMMNSIVPLLIKMLYEGNSPMQITLFKQLGQSSNQI